MSPHYTDVQLDALRELSNIASGRAATALSQMLGRDVEISVPLVQSLPLGAAIKACGAPEDSVSGVAIGVEGDLEALVMLLMPCAHADNLCRLLSVEPGTELGDSALREIGNIVCTSYLGGLAALTGLALEPSPPQVGRAAVRRVVEWAIAQRSDSPDAVLALDSELAVADEACSVSFLLLPSTQCAFDLLAPLGLAEPPLQPMGSVAMGQMAVSRSGEDDLVALGLGSCVGLALLDRGAGVAGLAHIVLPASYEPDAEMGKFADRAVPELIARMRDAGATPRRLEAVLVGGARMFAGAELDIGARNATAVRAALSSLGVSVRAAALGGTRGRTVRVSATTGTVTVKEAGGEPITVIGEPEPR